MDRSGRHSLPWDAVKHLVAPDHESSVDHGLHEAVRRQMDHRMAASQIAQAMGWPLDLGAMLDEGNS